MARSRGDFVGRCGDIAEAVPRERDGPMVFSGLSWQRVMYRGSALLVAALVATGVFWGVWSFQQSHQAAPPARKQKKENELLLRVRGNMDADFRPRVVFARPFPPITKLRIHSAEEAQKLLRPDELVLGVVLEGQARAYPINSLTGPRREVFNDTLAGRPIAATW